jgi:hypothetical protein
MPRHWKVKKGAEVFLIQKTAEGESFGGCARIINIDVEKHLAKIEVWGPSPCSSIREIWVDPANLVPLRWPRIKKLTNSIRNIHTLDTPLPYKYKT